MSVLYEPKGRAREYGELAVNIYSGGCPHQCLYCYVPRALHKTREQWLAEPLVPRDMSTLASELRRWREKYSPTQVFLCFTCDPYPIGIDTVPTRRVIETIKSEDFGLRMLTKGGLSATRDFDFYSGWDAFGITLTQRRDLGGWEPYAASPMERLCALAEAREVGIPTWVSLEPVLRPEWTLDCIRAVAGIADEVRIGKLNHPLAKSIDWKCFAHDAVDLCEKVGVNYKLKAELRKELEP